MNHRIAVFLLFFSTLPFLSFGQHSDNAHRQLTPRQLLDVKRGEAEHFKTLFSRFEVAWEEGELESMVDLKLGLTKLMELQIAKETTVSNDATGVPNRSLAKQKCFEKLQALELDINDNAIGKRAESVKALFKEFILLVELDISEQEDLLRKQ